MAPAPDGETRRTYPGCVNNLHICRLRFIPLWLRFLIKLRKSSCVFGVAMLQPVATLKDTCWTGKVVHVSPALSVASTDDPLPALQAAATAGCALDPCR